MTKHKQHLQCEMPDVTLTKPRGLSRNMFFKVYSGPNAIAFAQLSSRSGEQKSDSSDELKTPGVRYCLRNIEVAQNYRNRGIGSALLDEVISFCRDERVVAIYGEAKGEMDSLRRWYKLRGFELDPVDNIELSLA